MTGLFYNKTILDSIGEEAPKTRDDVVRIAQKATQDTNGGGKVEQYVGENAQQRPKVLEQVA